jgi:hypothetical protein
MLIFSPYSFATIKLRRFSFYDNPIIKAALIWQGITPGRKVVTDKVEKACGSGDSVPGFRA